MLRANQVHLQVFWTTNGWDVLPESLQRKRQDTACHTLQRKAPIFEAHQPYFSYRAILVAIVSQNSFMFVFMRSRTIIARYVATCDIAQMSLCKTSYQGGGCRTMLGKC